MSPQRTTNGADETRGGELERRLAAVWFADIVGFTRLADSDEDAALAAVGEFQRATRAAVEGRGRVVKFLGDGALAEFASARAALEAAFALRGAFPPPGSSSATALRIGIHVGEVAGAPDGDLYGDGVNLAARIQAAADPGEIVVSEDAARALRHGRGFRFDALGTHSLKGYRQPVQIFRVQAAESSRETGTGRSTPEDPPRPRAAGTVQRSIAVLPFANLSPDPGNEYFSDGVTEEILTSLARIEGLKVISRTSIMRYKGTTKPLHEIGRELGVASILEGSVRHSGSRVRITAQLVDAASDAHLWADRYDRDLEDIFAIQTDVAERIVESLHGRLSPGDRTRLAGPATTDRTAYEETLKGRWFANRRMWDNLARANEHFERAIDADPDHAPAHAGIATACVLLLHWDRPGSRALRDRAVEAAARAIRLDSGFPEPWAARAMTRIYDRDWTAADADFRRAIEVGPGDAQARQWRAHFLACMGRYSEAIAEIDRALELDPLSLAVITEAGNVRFLARRYDEALRFYRQAIDLDPAFEPARYKLFEAYLALGRMDEVMRLAVSLKRLDLEGEITIGSGPEAEREFLSVLADRAVIKDWPLFHVASVKAMLGRIDDAMQDLETAREEGDWYLVRAAVSPHCDPLRGDPRFARFLASIGLADVPLPEGVPAP
ncbi:MAG TPA: adenylate/guanylate cyclase domain-containing protein [Gemmatimonadota bacterium]|nr:adenylate/guanylate cyclase domain-containing protein [Gemmatimonadota bacterium]